MEENSLSNTLTRERTVKVLNPLQKTFESFSITEKVMFGIAAVIFTLGTFSLVLKISERYTVGIPLRGGSLVEGIVGTPRFVNPLLASSDADRDLSTLVYSGLLKETASGEFIPNLAESFTVSPDGLTYTFIIRANAVFHDGRPVTADDVEFTILKAQDPTLKSPRRVNWDGVTVTKSGTHNITLSLKQPYQPFISNLSMGILPKHIWNNFGSDEFAFSPMNLEPIGSGPYIVDSVERSKDGIPNSLKLKANPNYVLGEPYISTLTLSFFQNDKAMIDALQAKTIDTASNIHPEYADQASLSAHLLSAPFTRVFGVFFNQNEKEIFAHKEVRQALALSLDKQGIIDDILAGYGTVANGPLPKTINTATSSVSTTTAGTLLAKAGWKKNPATGVYEIKRTKTSATSSLSFTLSTANIPELAQSARVIEDEWSKFGAEIDVRVFEPSDLNTSVIRPRKYDALLFGMVTGKNPDLYPFWHSSQRNDPGLNIALYTNAKVDKMLEKMRQTLDPVALGTQYADFESAISADTPAVFIWSPNFIYAVSENLHDVELGEITTPSDRFISVEKWYIQTDHVWRIFVKEGDTVIN